MLLLCIFHKINTDWMERWLLQDVPVEFRLRLDGLAKLTKIKKEGKDQELIQSSTTPDPGYQ